MKRNLKTTAAVAFIGMAALLAGCSSSHNGPEGMHSVSWYRKNADARHKEMAWCNQHVSLKDAGGAACGNATQAGIQGSNGVTGFG
ncbi:exported protein of unknown function [Acidithiobacillus ferrivorans]|uniref:Lipoprotein n=1 Tax=Acidithiobacillus ferrivorans TaxID=160808 RepID=A0ABY1MLX7_9PROT|nr:hypothetical protein [Acidithiobacillus ferrivorans]SMH64781.1 exported protein of unknown function [Acidithiobacillus ferrivorans]